MSALQARDVTRMEHDSATVSPHIINRFHIDHVLLIISIHFLHLNTWQAPRILPLPFYNALLSIALPHRSLSSKETGRRQTSILEESDVFSFLAPSGNLSSLRRVLANLGRRVIA